jgi:FkbM family methyltransferase
MTVLDYEQIEVDRPGIPPLRFYVRTRPGSGNRDWSDRKAIAECVDRNTYQKPRLGFRIEPGDDWIDGGANVGGFSCVVNALGANLWAAYEPHGPNLIACHANLRLNGFDPTPAVGYAIVPDSHVGPTATLHVNAKPIQQRRHSMLLARKGSVPREVPVVRWSQIAEDRCVKLNIEGVEIQILREMTKPLPRKIVAEWSFDVEPRVQVLRDVIAKLEGWYRNVRVSKTIPPGIENWDWYPPNCFLYAWERR